VRTKLGNFILEAETRAQGIKTGTTKTGYSNYIYIGRAMLNEAYSTTSIR